MHSSPTVLTTSKFALPRLVEVAFRRKRTPMSPDAARPVRTYLPCGENVIQSQQEWCTHATKPTSVRGRAWALLRHLPHLRHMPRTELVVVPKRAAVPAHARLCDVEQVARRRDLCGRTSAQHSRGEGLATYV